MMCQESSTGAPGSIPLGVRSSATQRGHYRIEPGVHPVGSVDYALSCTVPLVQLFRSRADHIIVVKHVLLLDNRDFPGDINALAATFSSFLIGLIALAISSSEAPAARMAPSVACMAAMSALYMPAPAWVCIHSSRIPSAAHTDCPTETCRS